MLRVSVVLIAVMLIASFTVALAAQTVEGQINQLTLLEDRYFDAGDYESAIWCLSQKVTLEPSNVGYWGDLAWMHWNQERLPQAIATYKQCITVNPKNPAAWAALGEFYSKNLFKPLPATYYLAQAMRLGGSKEPGKMLAFCLRKLHLSPLEYRQWQLLAIAYPDDPLITKNLGGSQKRLVAWIHHASYMVGGVLLITASLVTIRRRRRSRQLQPARVTSCMACDG